MFLSMRCNVTVNSGADILTDGADGWINLNLELRVLVAYMLFSSGHRTSSSSFQTSVVLLCPSYLRLISL